MAPPTKVVLGEVAAVGSLLVTKKETTDEADPLEETGLALSHVQTAADES